MGKRWIVVLASIAVVLLLALAFNQPSGAVSGALREKASIGYYPFGGNVLFYIALENGYFAEQGLEVEAVRFDDLKMQVNSVVAGKVDAAAALGYSTAFAVEAAQPGELKLFGFAGETLEKPVSLLVVAKNSSIRALADLKGKTIAAGGVSNIPLIKLALKNSGQINDPDKDVAFADVSSKLLLEALASGQVDVIYAPEPLATIAVEKGVGRVLVKSLRAQYIMNPMPTGSIGMVSTKFMREKPLVVKKIVNAFEKALDYFERDEAGARRILAKHLKLEENIAMKMNLYWFKKSMLAGAGDEDAPQKVADLLYENGLLKKRVSVSGLLLTERDFS
jgi:NitT/TauT family transport system substrate-binding protein